MDVEARVVDEPMREAAAIIVDAVRAGGHIALSGGGTPRPAYERAALLGSDWSRVELWFADERCVPPRDERSNYRLVRESLLDRLGRPPKVAHRVHGELPPKEAADAYESELADVVLDLALLGIGPDGHTASLFPHAPALEERNRRVVEAESGLEPLVDRVTMTVPALCSSQLVVFLVTGEEKAEAVEAAFARPPGPATPASLIRGERTVAVLDRAAAARLSG